MVKLGVFLPAALLCALACVGFCSRGVSAQTNVAVPGEGVAAKPVKKIEITQIDAPELVRLLRPNGKPLLINFWATWCDPCREEFPDLVKIDTEYRGKLDFITISLDDVSDINSRVPKFLTEMKAEMPAYLLKTLDESQAIESVSKEWKGGLPFTILLNEKGSSVYARQGKVRLDVMRIEIDKLIPKNVE